MSTSFSRDNLRTIEEADVAVAGPSGLKFHTLPAGGGVAGPSAAAGGGGGGASGSGSSKTSGAPGGSGGEDGLDDGEQDDDEVDSDNEDINDRSPLNGDFRQRSRSLTPNTKFIIGDDFNEEDDEYEEMSRFRNGQEPEEIDLGHIRVDGSEDGVPDEQLTITSSGSKVSAKSTGSLIVKDNDGKKGKNWLCNNHLNPFGTKKIHPHTITCRPISEASSLTQLSLASSLFSDPNSPMCKICHLHAKEADPLISPCKCAGTMQYIHCGCLMRWLEVSSKKSRKPLSCELCQYQYHWHKRFKVRHWQFPHCSKRDKILHLLFFLSVAVMVACAAITVMCFKHDRGQRLDPHRNELTESEIVTLICGVLFFLSFFMAMYVEVKSRNTLYKLMVKFIYLNQQWYIDEYEKKELGPVDV